MTRTFRIFNNATRAMLSHAMKNMHRAKNIIQLFLTG